MATPTGRGGATHSRRPIFPHGHATMGPPVGKDACHVFAQAPGPRQTRRPHPSGQGSARHFPWPEPWARTRWDGPGHPFRPITNIILPDFPPLTGLPGATFLSGATGRGGGFGNPRPVGLPNYLAELGRGPGSARTWASSRLPSKRRPSSAGFFSSQSARASPPSQPTAQAQASSSQGTAAATCT